MQVNDMLRILNVDPTQLPPAPGPTATAEEAFARVGRTPQPCVACGQPATATSIADIPSIGPCWIDKCTPHMIAVTKTDSPTAAANPVDVLRDAVREAGADVALHAAPLTEAECPRG